MVQEMAAICRDLTQPVTFPVRAVLVRQSISELVWLLQQSDRYDVHQLAICFGNVQYTLQIVTNPIHLSCANAACPEPKE